MTPKERFTRKRQLLIQVLMAGFHCPPDLIDRLNLKWKRRGRAVLGDGSECVFNVYEAVVIWDADHLTIPIDEADSEPLVGISLMEGYQLTVQVFEEGSVEIRKVNAV